MEITAELEGSHHRQRDCRGTSKDCHRRGHDPLRRSGLLKVRGGMTTIEEVVRETVQEH